MKHSTYINMKLISLVFVLSIILSSCEKDLKPLVFNRFSTTTFFKSADDAKAALTASYVGLRSIWGTSNYETTAQSSMSTDELVCSWGWVGWKQLNDVDFSEDFPDGVLNSPYLNVMPIITNITLNIDKISSINMDETLKARYIGELKALRAIYSLVLYDLYGPVPIRIDPKEAGDPASLPIPRPTAEAMVAQIEKDFNDAIPVLPAQFNGVDYGRISSAACYTGLMKLYMHEKRWQDAINMGEKIGGMGYSIVTDYASNFTSDNKNGNSEIILAIPTRGDDYSNTWTMCSLPSNYVDPDGQLANEWGGYKLPWKIYDKFNPSDKRLQFMLAKYPSFGGELFDARANGYVGAIPMKYKPQTGAGQGGENIIVWRYADVKLLLAEAINELKGPNDESYSIMHAIRNRAGLGDIPTGLNKDQFRDKIMDERLFELWCEGTRRSDMIRWGTYIKRAIDNGSIYAKPEFVLYPIPRVVINETKGVVKQNPGYE